MVILFYSTLLKKYTMIFANIWILKSCFQANSARLVTKIRWIVESVNGRLKQWRYLQNVVPNTQIPYIGEYVCLIVALCNKYRQPLNQGNEDSDQILGAKMKVILLKSMICDAHFFIVMRMQCENVLKDIIMYVWFTLLPHIINCLVKQIQKALMSLFFKRET